MSFQTITIKCKRKKKKSTQTIKSLRCWVLFLSNRTVMEGFTDECVLLPGLCWAEDWLCWGFEWSAWSGCGSLSYWCSQIPQALWAEETGCTGMQTWSHKHKTEACMSTFMFLAQSIKKFVNWMGDYTFVRALSTGLTTCRLVCPSYKPEKRQHSVSSPTETKGSQVSL